MKLPNKLLQAVFNLFHQKPSEKDIQEINSWYDHRSKDDVQEEDESAKSRIWQNIQQGRGHKINYWPRYTIAAASILLCLGFVWYFYAPSESRQLSKIADYGPKQGANIVYAKIENPTTYEKIIKTIEVDKGQQYQTILSDQTEIKLNADSKLEVVLFNDTIRKVRLTGEGYFHVSKDEKRPFVVETSKQTITVLGTKFNIRSYENMTEELSLLEGKVKTSVNNKEIFLTPGESLKINADEVKKTELSNTNLLWMDEVFAFEDQTLTEIVENVSRWYNIPVQDFEEDGNLFTGKIRKRASLQEVLQLIRIVSQKDIQIDKNNRLIIK